ncbi:hypothetical protein PV325_004785 [Microctonus aethiopoides]|nr:hypothetical protein PV325_004785 [Microctonus aethiopoides]KAK0091261.1 hypothetical protein PV326_003506 [Microctonus aethiopoides]
MGNCTSISPPQCNYNLPKETVRLTLQCKICGFIVCIVATIIYIFLPLTFFNFSITALLMPAFLTGYIIINAVGIIENFSNRHNVIIDIYFNTLGTCANLWCVIDLTRDWILWLIKKSESSAPSYYGLEYFLLILTLILNITTMVIQLSIILRSVKRRSIPRHN